MRVGIGYDAHPLVKNRRLVIGGVDIPSDKGLLGHSDGDVLCHAIIDALLGAANLGDIGEFFPEENKYKNAKSILLLKKVVGIIEKMGYRVVNVDSTVVASSPRLSSYRKKILENLKSVLNSKNVSVKFKTGNGLGFEGKGEGISAIAICMIAGGEGL
ncbi:MAG TPA: 2-C-methyl-D-erythritol 2,4-cyclodiphosphate synthase [Thermotoga sp.]|nr:2-C-methyl-D-erythritol 2,4-cyclodiphosphate synthase [Thermotoga sp.]